MHHPKRVILPPVIYVVIEPAIYTTPTRPSISLKKVRLWRTWKAQWSIFFALYKELALDITDRERVRIMGEINIRSNGKLL